MHYLECLVPHVGSHQQESVAIAPQTDMLPPLCLLPSGVDLPVPNVDPMQWHESTMVLDTFNALPRHPGYKYELWDGTASIRPADSALATLVASLREATRRAEQRSCDASGAVRPLRPDDRNALVDLWTEVFDPLPDYGLADRVFIRSDAERQLDELLADPASEEVFHSRVATTEGTIVGALLTTTFGSTPEIDVIFVAPDYRNQGIGSALLEEVGQRLLQAGEHRIVSGYHLANEGSRTWHRRLGFYELPDLTLARHRYRCVRMNLDHGHYADPEAARDHVAHLERVIDRMERAEQDHFSAVHPSQWPREEEGLLERYFLLE